MLCFIFIQKKNLKLNAFFLDILSVNTKNYELYKIRWRVSVDGSTENEFIMNEILFAVINYLYLKKFKKEVATQKAPYPWPTELAG